MKTILYGTADQEPQTEVTAILAQEVYNSNLLYILIVNLARVDFEVSPLHMLLGSVTRSIIVVLCY